MPIAKTALRSDALSVVTFVSAAPSGSMLRTLLLLSALPALVSAHGAIVTPRSRNSVDYLVGINTPKDWSSDAECTNISSNGYGCFNGQAAFYYSQGHVALESDPSTSRSACLYLLTHASAPHAAGTAASSAAPSATT